MSQIYTGYDPIQGDELKYARGLLERKGGQFAATSIEVTSLMRRGNWPLGFDGFPGTTYILSTGDHFSMDGIWIEIPVFDINTACTIVTPRVPVVAVVDGQNAYLQFSAAKRTLFNWNPKAPVIRIDKGIFEKFYSKIQPA